MEKPYGIIYVATHRDTGRVYVGQTIRPLKVRLSRHMQDAKWLFGLALRKYGLDAFDIEVAYQASSREDLDAKEVELIRFHNSMHPNGFNHTLGGGGVGGWCASDEAIERMRAGKAANPMSPEGRAAVSAAMSGRVLSPETREKLATAQRGRKRVFSEEHRMNLSLSSKGHKRLVGRKHSDEAKARMSASQKGLRKSAEHIEKLRQANIAHYQKKRLES